MQEAPSVIAEHLGTNTGSATGGVIIIEEIARLEGVPLDRQKLLAASAISASMRVYDDAFDGDRDGVVCTASPADILRTIRGDKPITELPRALSRCLSVAGDTLNPAASTVLVELTGAQIDSMRQRDPSLSVEDVSRISRRKGAATFTLFALVADADLASEKRVCYEEFGYFVQLIDDAIDHESDTTTGIHTLATILTPRAFSFSLWQQYHRVRAVFLAHYSAEKLQKLFAYMNQMMASVGLIVN